MNLIARTKASLNEYRQCISKISKHAWLPLVLASIIMIVGLANGVASIYDWLNGIFSSPIGEIIVVDRNENNRLKITTRIRNPTNKNISATNVHLTCQSANGKIVIYQPINTYYEQMHVFFEPVKYEPFDINAGQVRDFILVFITDELKLDMSSCVKASIDWRSTSGKLHKGVQVDFPFKANVPIATFNIFDES